MMGFETDDYLFRPLSNQDEDFFYELEKDPEVLKYYRRDIAHSLDESNKTLKAYMEYSALHPNMGAFVVIEKATQVLVGLGVVIHLDKNPHNQELEIGYRLPVKHWNKGHATKIAKALIGYASHMFPEKEILGTTHPDNLASQKVLLKAGMIYSHNGMFHGGENKVFKFRKF